MHHPKFHNYRLFSNLDPLEVGYEDQLRKGGQIVATIHSEYILVGIQRSGGTLVLILKKVWTDGSGQPLDGLLKLRFENAAISPSPVNAPEDTFETSTELRDIRPYELAEKERTAGRKMGAQLSTDQGLWDMAFAEATAEFDPPV